MTLGRQDYRVNQAIQQEARFTKIPELFRAPFVIQWQPPLPSAKLASPAFNTLTQAAAPLVMARAIM